MTDNMQKMMNLVDEFSKLVETSNAEKKRLEKEIAIAKQEKLDAFLKDMEDFTKIAIKLQNSITVETKAKSRYNINTNYSLRVNAGWYGITVMSGSSCCGSIPYGGRYCDKERWYSNLQFSLDNILDAWDRDDFEVKFAKKVVALMETKAKITNDNLEYTKKLYEKEVKA